MDAENSLPDNIRSAIIIEMPDGPYFCTGWSERFPDNSLFQPTEQVNKLVEAGKIGMKSGEGFYSYKKS